MQILLRDWIKHVDRIKAYEDAGADMIFPEAMKDENEFEKVRKIQMIFISNMTEFGKSKLLDRNIRKLRI